MGKLCKRTFAVPALATGFVVANEAAALGYDFKTCVLVVVSALAWALIESWRDVTLMRAGRWHAAPPAPPAGGEKTTT